MTMSFARRKLLADLRTKPRELKPNYRPLAWALAENFAILDGSRYALTPAGGQALAEAEMDPPLRQAVKLLPRLGRKTLCRQSSAVKEAVEEGGGFIYFTEPDHRPFPLVSGRLLIEKGYLKPQDDGLFSGMSQTFVVAANG